MTKKFDMDMLAVDLADLLSNDEYNIDIGAADVLTALPEFVAAMRARACAHQEAGRME